MKKRPNLLAVLSLQFLSYYNESEWQSCVKIWAEVSIANLKVLGLKKQPPHLQSYLPAGIIFGVFIPYNT